jgi:hypothetical protein
MKKIDTTPIAPGIAYPFPKKGLNFLQQSYQEAITHLSQALIGNSPSTTIGYVMYGCIKTLISGSNYSFTAGAIFFNGEIYPVAAIASIIIGTAAILKISDVADPVADPTTFTDLSTQHVHRVRTIVISDGALNSGDLNYDDVVFYNRSQTYVPVLKAYDNTSTEVVGGFTTSGGILNSWVFRGGSLFFYFS